MPVPVDEQRSANRNSAESRVYMDQLWQRLRVFSKRSAAIPAEEPGSFEWLSSAGAFWRQARERADLSREDLAQELGIPINQVLFMEFGLSMPKELSERRLRAYARALGTPDLYEQFHERFEQ